jgi:hypothetical protein
MVSIFLMVSLNWIVSMMVLPHYFTGWTQILSTILWFTLWFALLKGPGRLNREPKADDAPSTEPTSP